MIDSNDMIHFFFRHPYRIRVVLVTSLLLLKKLQLKRRKKTKTNQMLLNHRKRIKIQCRKWTNMRGINVKFVVDQNDAINNKNQKYLSVVQFVKEMVSHLIKQKSCGRDYFSHFFPYININSAHPTCLKMSARMVRRINEYAWQCKKCKSCIKCRRNDNDDKMLFCDQCDRSYHIYCIGLRKVPNGNYFYYY